MRILFLTQVFPFPLDAGPKIRAYYVLRHLAQQHEVTLISFVRATHTPAAVAHLREFCTAVHTVPMPRSKMLDGAHLLRSLVTGQPFIIARDSVATMRRLLAQVLRESSFDVVHADQLWMAPYALWARRHVPGKAVPKIILDQHNAVYLIPQRLIDAETNLLKHKILELESRKLIRYEIDICRQFDRVVWVTHDDYAAVQQQVTAGLTVPNAGVIPICGAPGEVPMLERKADVRRVTFLGGLHYPPNAQGILWFAEAIFPKILAAAPDAVLTVIGKQPPEKLHALGIPPRNLEVTGFVADPQRYLRETSAFIVPLQAGGGMRVKILDAWQWGIPIVSTRVGAEGIKLCEGQNILLADSPTEFAQATLRLLRQPLWGQQLATAGRHWVEQHYNWRTVYQRWDQVYRSASEAPVAVS